MNRSARVSDRWVEPMSTVPAPTLGPDRGSLPPKKRDPRQGAPEPRPAATFKVPYPYKSQHAVKGQYSLHPDFLHQPLPAPVTPLYQPWVQSPTATRSKPYAPSPLRNSWAEWRDLYHRGVATVDSRWDYPLIHRGLLTGQLRELSASSALPLERPRQPTGVRPTMLSSEGLRGMGSGYRWESTAAQGESGAHVGRPRGLHVRGQGGQGSQSQRSLGASPAPLIRDSFSPAYGCQSELAHAEQTAAAVESPLGPFPCDRPTEKHWTSGIATDAVDRPPSSSSSSSSSSSTPDQPPWLLPHFAAGSLIELRDGRLRRVEDLQVEDFRTGVAACPELRLRRCTVQHISPAASPALSRLLILLHEEHSQELVDVFAEYPFFVCGRGWSSCCPQRTASLCGLRCHQLSVGDVCLALTPASPPRGAPPPAQGPGVPANGAEGRPGSLPCPRPALPTPAPPPAAPDRPNVGQGGGGAEPTRRKRRRRWSAPELPGPGAAVSTEL